MDERGNGPKEKHGQQAGERKLFGVLVVFGVAALFLGFFQVLNAIRGPFQPKKATNTPVLGQTGSTIELLKSKDTDGDGISDFDELYIYHTSPYLADSDSDNISDGTEVDQGTDPNCAQGQACSPLEGVTNANTATNSAATNSVVTNDNTNTVLANQDVNTVQNAAGISLSDLRVALRNAGAPESTLQGLSDSELLALYQEVITGQDTSGSTNTTATNTTNSSVNTASPTNTTASNINVQLPTNLDQTTLSNLTPDQIRTFLRGGGADESLLQQVDDATLRSIFNDAIGNLQNTNS